MAEKLQLNIQGALCQASEGKIVEIAKDFELDVDGKKKSTIVNMIFHHIDKEWSEKSEEERLSFLTKLRSQHLEAMKEVTAKPKSPESVKEQSTLKTMLESTSVLRRQFKIVGQIGQPDQKDKLSFTSLSRQMETGLKQGYNEQEIVDGVIRAISAGMVLRSYLETYKDLSLERLNKILRNHYGVKNSTELYQSLASICQGPKETAQEFLMRALDLRQNILFSNGQDSGEDTLVYEADHIQKLFLRTVETGLHEDNVRVKIRSYLKDPNVSDEELLKQVNTAVSAENERARKMRSQNRGKPAQVTQVTEGDCVSQKESPIKPSGNKSQDELLKALEAIKVEVAEVKSKLKDMNQESEEARGKKSRQEKPDDRRNQYRKTQPKCSKCQVNQEDRCSHCFLCGSENHYAIGCRQNRGNSALNSNRLLPRDRK